MINKRKDGAYSKNPAVIARRNQEIYCWFGIRDSLAGKPPRSKHPVYLDGYYHGKL